MSIETRESMEAFLRALEGPFGDASSMAVEYGAVRRMALAVENFDPIHFDRESAVARGYRDVVAPWPYLWLVFFNCSDHEPDFPFGSATVHGEDGYEFFEPIVVGDRITVSTEIANTSVKQGKSGLMGLLVQRRRFHNQNDQLCAVLSTTLIRR